MPISKDLFLAILSMDAYNRGYGSGLGDGTNVDGQGADLDGLGGLGSKIGTATITQEDVSPEAQATGFYALAYEMDAEVGTGSDKLLVGDTVIACRGAAAAGRIGFVRPRSRTPSAPARLRPGAGRGNPGRADRCRSRPPAA